MRRLLITLFYLVVSVYLGLLLVQYPGYLLVVSQPWIVQMPLWFAAVSLLLFIAVFYFITSSVDHIQFLWFRLTHWLKIRREHRSLSRTQRGLAALVEGRFKKAEKLLSSSIDSSPEPLVNFLSAAKAAHEQGAPDRRDHYLSKALDQLPHAELAIHLTKAELLLAEGRLEEACALLSALQKEAPYHPRVLMLLKQTYLRLGDATLLQTLVPVIRKAKVLPADELLALEVATACEGFHAASGLRVSELRALWKQLPRHLHKHPDVIFAYVSQLAIHVPVTGDDTSKEVKELIRAALKQAWHPGLVTLYGTLTFTDLNRQLVLAGAWLKRYGEEPELLLLLGKICAKLQLWGRAKDYFSKCLARGFYSQASLEYGRLLENLGEKEKALLIYREALSS